MYVPKHFTADELLPPHVFYELGSDGFKLIDDRVLITLDNLRERFGAITVNDYSWGGEREWSGLRTPDSPYYSKYSQHTFGRAADCIFKYAKAQTVRMVILNDINNPLYKHITALERGVSWLHFDVRNTERVQVFDP